MPKNRRRFIPILDFSVDGLPHDTININLNHVVKGTVKPAYGIRIIFLSL